MVFLVFLLQSLNIRHPLRLIGYLNFLIFMISAVSIWDPFCKEDILYTPYVRVYQKGRSGVLLRDRGPGFIDIGSLKDIYVCTNGLVMMYYAKTKGMGEVFEHGELHSTPHHCELYNPSSNSGMEADHPKKTLLSILLMGHPQDYRRPALQMFVAPTYDTVYEDYINITSLIMMGSDGECIIEKGVEGARLRINNADSTFKKNGTNPPIFCQLDAQRKLGQRGIITMNWPGQGGMYKFIKRPTFFNGTLPENVKFRVQHSRQKSETGSSIYPRFGATSIKTVKDSYGLTAYSAEEVYAALINDRKMRFVGCLRYPNFSLEQMRIIETRKNNSQQLDLEKEGLLIKDSEPPFWAEKVNVPWPDSANSSKTNDARYNLYLGVDVTSGDVDFFDVSKQSLETAVKDLITQKLAKAEDAIIKAAEDAVIKEKMLFSLWPLKRAYAILYIYLKDLEEQVKKAWEAVNTEVFEVLSDDPDLTDVETKNVSLIAHWQHIILLKISQTKFERRFEPYNRQLVQEYDKYVDQLATLNSLLKKKSIALGPKISAAEVLNSRYRVYKSLLKRTISELQQAVRQLEKTGKPVDVVPEDPFDRYFVDTMIDLTNAAFVHTTPKTTVACFELPAQNVSCKGIKPTSERAGTLLKNRQGKGRDWPAEDMWRGQVLDLVEQIFDSVCPYMNKDFASSLTKILKGYLLAEPLGTGLKVPIVGSRLKAVDHEYQAIVYNMTYDETNVENMTDFGEGKLRPMQPFWENIISALEDCKNKAVPMQFWHNEDGGRPAYVSYRKFFPNNNTEAYYDVEELMMQEKADLEYSFNWAVDLNWRIFATVLGICMPQYEKTIPLISARFYSLYSKDFLHPLRQIWMSSRDNAVLRTILGNYYNRGQGERWTKICMESSFMESGDRNYRPPRNLYVNAFTEMNYFTNGPLAGTSGILSVGENGI